MKKEIKAMWVKALRSGKYKKATGQLRKTDEANEPTGYCCLGVLSDLYLKEHPKAKGWDKGIFNNDADLPTRVRRWAGLSASDPVVKYRARGRNGEESLSYINDKTRQTFKGIAGIIAKQL